MHSFNPALAFRFKDQWLIILLTFLVICCSEDTKDRVVTFSGQVTGKNVNGEIASMANVPVDIIFYESHPLLKFTVANTERIFTDGNGQYILSKEIPLNAYDAYEVKPVDSYYKTCSEFFHSEELHEYLQFQPEENNVKDIELCIKGHILVSLNKILLSSSRSIQVAYALKQGDITFINHGNVFFEDGELNLYFSPRVQEVVFTFTERNNGIVINTREVTTIPQPGITLSVNADF